MVPKRTSEDLRELAAGGPGTCEDSDGTPTKSQILEDIREGYLFVKSGGKGRSIDKMHREIAEELAREELAINADIRL